MRASQIMRKALWYDLILALAILVIGGGIGLAVAGVPGMVSAFIGAGLTVGFMALTAGSILIATRVTAGEPSPTVFFAIILGTWLVKIVVFIVLMLWLRAQDWLQPMVLFVAILAAVIGTLVAEVLAFTRSRVPYVDDTVLEGVGGPDAPADSPNTPADPERPATP